MKKKCLIFSVSLKKDFIFRFHIYFSGSFAFYFLISDLAKNLLNYQKVTEYYEHDCSILKLPNKVALEIASM